jgi:hypothetical protein
VELEARYGRRLRSRDSRRPRHLGGQLQQTLLKISEPPCSRSRRLVPGRRLRQDLLRREHRIAGSMNPDTIVEKEEIKRVIIQVINELRTRRRRCWSVLLRGPHPQGDRQVLEVTESRVSQLHTKAILRAQDQAHLPPKGDFLSHARTVIGSDGVRSLHARYSSRIRDGKDRGRGPFRRGCPSQRVHTALPSALQARIRRTGGRGGECGIGAEPWKIRVNEIAGREDLDPGAGRR